MKKGVTAQEEEVARRIAELEAKIMQASSIEEVQEL